MEIVVIVLVVLALIIAVLAAGSVRTAVQRGKRARVDPAEATDLPILDRIELRQIRQFDGAVRATAILRGRNPGMSLEEAARIVRAL